MRTVFFPKSEIPVSKCNHRYGKDITFSEQTDSRFLSSTYTAEKYGFKNNVRLGIFANNQLSSQQNQGITEQSATGLMRIDTYYSVDLWRNPNTGVIETIPDHFATQWTAAGAEFFDVVIGEAKPTQMPNHGQQLYDLTAGALGYDFNTDTIGASNLLEWNAVHEGQQNWHLEMFGRNSSAYSYRNGNYNTNELLRNKILGVRNSNSSRLESQNADTYYGSGLGHTEKTVLSLEDFFLSYDSTTRSWDAWETYGQTRQQAIDYVIFCLDRALLDSGWVRDFIHWHSARTNGNLDFLDELLATVQSWAVGKNVHFCSNGEALEYMFFRESVTNVSAYEKYGNVQVVYWANARGTNIHSSQMNTPLSVEIDLSGTVLAGQSVKSSYGKLISLGGDQYIAEVPYQGEFGAIELSVGVGGIHNTDRPTGTMSDTGSVLTINTDMPTRAVVFSGVNDATTFRSNMLSTSHQINISGITEYTVGIISEFGQANLIEM